ncbi:hypothetical protein TELCIR_02152 [Teladorsagia circumcincta]|uniref:DNA2/NAM7 helicase-like C-terminal domain-containing protein n=1 Tax=Teladorsagia circumcincta TaxID=45464 RepID=A0A2G9UZY2_TELCI|nr:hypothetical protein TELCIR_02152 [Teladorsagia circumcincta]
METQGIRPVRYVSETLARDAIRSGPYDLACLMEHMPETHADMMDDRDMRAFTFFADRRRRLLEFVLTSVERNLIASEHQMLLFLEQANSERIKTLTTRLLKIYEPNVFICTISLAINLTIKNGLWRRPLRKWSTVFLEEASMIREATLIGLFSRFPDAIYTLVGDSNQLPPYIGTQRAPLAAYLCSRSALEVTRRVGNPPTCKISSVYRPHPNMMALNSRIFYNNELVCGTPNEARLALLNKVWMPNSDLPIAFINIVDQSVQSVTGSQSNAVEARAVAVIVRLLLASSISADIIMVICLYRDQLYLVESAFKGFNVAMNTVDSAQGSEKSVIIVCTTRTHLNAKRSLTFFADPKRLNVALSRARDGSWLDHDDGGRKDSPDQRLLPPAPLTDRFGDAPCPRRPSSIGRSDPRC